VLTYSLTEAFKQALAEAAYYKTLEHQQDDFEQRHDNTVSALPPHISASEPVSHLANRTPGSSSSINDWTTLFAAKTAPRRDSDDSLKTAYTKDDTVPESAYRSRPDLRPGVAAQQTSFAAPVTIDNPLETDLISTFTDY
jgi:hypothetical protein